MLGALVVSAAPALSMLLGSASVVCVTVPDWLQASLQMFSAGLLISAVAGELFPLLSIPHKATDADTTGNASLEETLGIAVGFLIGLLFMFGLAHLTEGADDDEEEEEKPNPLLASPNFDSLGTNLLDEREKVNAMSAFRDDVSGLQDDVVRLEPLLDQEHVATDDIDQIIHNLEFRVHRTERNLSKRKGSVDARNKSRMKDHLQELKRDLDVLSSANTPATAVPSLKAVRGTIEHLHGHVERPKFQRWKPVVESPNKRDSIPFALVGAVTVDAAVDGLLIGLAYSARASAGWAMSIATCIEMGFLGLTFCATIKNATRSLVTLLGLAIVPPAMLLVVGIGGYATGDALEQSPAVKIGLIAFSIVALLFLVTQELLSEAKEVAGDSVIINIIFFVGLLGGIILEKALD